MRHGKLIHDASNSVLTGMIEEEGSAYGLVWEVAMSGSEKEFRVGSYWGWRVEYDLEPLPITIQFPFEDWQYEVANGDTCLGYTEWVQHKSTES